MILVLSFRLAGRIHRYLYTYAPSNILIRHLRSPSGQKWALPISAVLGVAYFSATVRLTTLIEAGGPGWLNLIALISAWNAIKLTWVALASAVAIPRRLLSRRPHSDRTEAVARA